MNLELFVPEISLAVTVLIVILLDLMVTRKGWLVAVSLAGLIVSAAFTLAMWGGSGVALFNNMLAVDNYALFFKLLFLSIAALVILSSVDYVARFSRFQVYRRCFA